MIREILEYATMHFNALALAGFTIIVTVGAGRWLRTRFLPYIYTLTGDTITSLDDAVVLALSKLGSWFYLILGIRVSSFLIYIPQDIEVLISVLFTVIVIAQLGKGFLSVVLQLTKERYFSNKETHNFTLIAVITRIIFWIIIFLLILTNLNVKITPLLASLGVIGIAISFALQNILEDLFASISIYLDKPFRLGDYITMGQDGGTVDHVGIKTTRIRTVLGEELVIANRKLTDSIIHNYGKIDERTVTQDFTVSFNSTKSDQTTIPNIVKKACRFSKLIDFQWCHLIKIGNFGLDYQLRYTLKSSDYATHLQIQEKILLNIIASLSKKGIKIVKKGIAQ